MPTLTEYRQRMLDLEPDDLGRVYDIASLTATTVVVTALATGTVDAGKYANKWLLRPLCASAADRLRITTDTGFAAATGTLTHAGANYSDTTATGETVEVHEHEPSLLDNAVQRALHTTRFLHESYVPTNAAGRYYLGDLDWIESPQDIFEVGVRPSPVLTRNRHFEHWNTVHTDGTLRPDGWALAGSGATFTRESTNVRRGRFALSVMRSGSDAFIDQTIELMASGVDDDSLRGKVVTSVLVGRSGAASSLLVRADSLDYAGTVLSSNSSSTHSGNDNYEELTAEHTVHADAERVRLRARLAVDETAEIDELYLMVGTLTDGVRRDDARVLGRFKPRDLDWEQGSTLLMRERGRGFGQQVVFKTQRRFHTFDAARVRAGTADADAHDAPLDLIAMRALAIFYRDQANGAAGTAAVEKKAKEYERAADGLADGYLHDPSPEPGFTDTLLWTRGTRVSGRIR